MSENILNIMFVAVSDLIEYDIMSLYWGVLDTRFHHGIIEIHHCVRIFSVFIILHYYFTRVPQRPIFTQRHIFQVPT